jgi:hypothetical protein
VSGPGQIHPYDEERVATDVSREIEALANEAGIRPPVGFADRVMAAIAAEPLPQPVRAFGVALTAGRLHAAAASVGDAWRVVGGGPTPFAVQAQSVALVLMLAIGSLAVAGGATVGAMGMLTANPPPAVPTTSSPSAPVPSDPQPSPSPSPSLGPDESPDASPTVEPTETPEATERPETTDGPRTSTPEPRETDDHGGASGGDGSDGDDHGGGSPGTGSGPGDDDHTPSPTESDDHGIDDE